MHYIGPLALEELCELCARIGRPYRPCREFGFLHNADVLLDVPVAALKRNYGMAGAAEEIAFLSEYDILTARLLIGIVN